MSRRRDLDKFIDETRTSQRNIVFPDTVRNARSVDAFFWRGSPNPPLVQRIGAWLFGLSFIGVGLGFCSLAVKASAEDDSAGTWAMILISICCVLLGARTFRNGFPRPIRPKTNSN